MLKTHPFNLKQFVLVLGKKLWAEQMERSDRIITATEKDREQEKEEPKREIKITGIKKKEWSADKVLSTIEKLICRSVYLIRRSRWLIRLSKSSLTWEKRVKGRTEKIMIVFERGKIIRRVISPAKEIQNPPGYRRTIKERQKSFDIATYDRM